MKLLSEFYGDNGAIAEVYVDMGDYIVKTITESLVITHSVYDTEDDAEDYAEDWILKNGKK